MRYALALDLMDDAALIEQYEAHHRRIWPEVRDHLHAHGVVGMEIYRLGTRMFMVMDVNDAVYSAQVMAQASTINPIIAKWEALMWTFQVPTPWTPAGEKWTPMKRIFDLASQSG
jgi:L-rhamnose mutarotase